MPGKDGAPRRLGADLRRRADHLDDRVVEKERGQPVEVARSGGLARRAQVRGDRRLCLGRHLAATPLRVDPQVRRDAEEPCARVGWLLPHLRDRDERAGQRVLAQVLGIPRAARQVPAVSVELRAERLIGVVESSP